MNTPDNVASRLRFMAYIQNVAVNLRQRGLSPDDNVAEAVRLNVLASLAEESILLQPYDKTAPD